MRTSYFSKYKEANGVSIAIGTPNWHVGYKYPDLFPTWELVDRIKSESITEDEYTEIYLREVLSNLNAKEVYNNLKGKVLLCWCGPDSFCHRHIVSAWLEEELGVSIEEV